MRSLFASGLCGLILVACSSDDKPDSGQPGRTACVSEVALQVRRDACEFAKGSRAVDTVGGCAKKPIPIEHVIIIMQENRSFDQYFGHLPGHGQDDVDVPKTPPTNAGPDGTEPSTWYHESAYCVADTDHGWGASHRQFNNGLNDGFAISNAKAVDPSGRRAMGYYDHTDLPFYYQLASTFAISDRYFCSLLGPTYPNRMFLAAGTSFGIVTTKITTLAPPGAASIYRSLNERGVTWKDYRTNLPSMLLFPDFATDPAQAEHLAAATDFAKDAADGNLPQVTFLDSGFSQAAAIETDEHPPANMQLGQRWVYDQIVAVMNGPLWEKSAIFITYDEHGGLYDHVPPPSACAPDDTPPVQSPELGSFDRLGFRVPLIVVSPYARRHFVSHEVHSHTSILRFLQAKFDLPALTKRDANSDALLDLFDFGKPDFSVPEFAAPPVDEAKLEACRVNFPAANNE